ncbi:MAG: hypothetical protein H6702_01510 [Myxococcales bacterium]|nr:hypothetical protein [Myxococcales bacterium]
MRTCDWLFLGALLAVGCSDDAPASKPAPADMRPDLQPGDMGPGADMAPAADEGVAPDQAPPPRPEAVWVEVTLQPRRALYALDAEVRVSATAFDRVGAPIDGAPLTWSVAPPGAATLADGRLNFLAEGPGAVVACAGDGVCGRAAFFVDGGPPSLVLASPLRGESLGQDGSETIHVAGTAADSGGAVSVRVNGTPVALGEGGAFTLDLPARFGINRIEVVADDGVQDPVRDVREVLWAPRYTPVDETGATLRDALAIRIDQALLDANRPVDVPGEAAELTLQGAAQILELLIALADVTGVLGDPQLVDTEAFSLRVARVDLGKPEIDLFFSNAGAELFMRLPRIAVATEGGIEVQGAPISLDGTLRASMAAFASLHIAVVDGALQVEVGDVGIAVESLTGNFANPTAEVLVETFGSRLGTLARDLANDLVLGLIEEQLPTLITGVLDGLLTTLAEIPIDVSAPIEGIPPLNLRLAITPAGLDLQRRELMGLRMDARVSHLAPVLAPHADPGVPTLSRPEYLWVAGEGLGGVVRLALLNGLLHEVWRAGLLQLTPPLPPEVSVLLSAVTIDGRLPPVVAPAPEGSDLPLEVQLGDLRVAVTGPRAEAPDLYAVDLRVGVSVAAEAGQFELVVAESPLIRATLIDQAGDRPFLSGEQLATLLEGLVWPQVQEALAGGLAFGIDPIEVDPATLAGFAPRVTGLSLTPRFEGAPAVREGRAELEGGIDVGVRLAAP